MWSFSVKNFRALKECSLQLHPGEVYALVGRSGGGKTSLLTALLALQKMHTVSRGMPEGFGRTTVQISIGGWSWEISPRITQRLIGPQTVEELQGSDMASSARPELQPLQWLIKTMNVHTKHVSEDHNLVLDYNALPPDQKIWVDNQTRQAFPGLDLHPPSGGIQSYLLHLTVLVQAPPKSILAFEAPEQRLHPFAIRRLLEVFRAQAREKELTLLLATHSPVLLNEFQTAMENILIVSPGKTAAITELFDPNWLHHFLMGDLYAREEFDL